MNINDWSDDEWREVESMCRDFIGTKLHDTFVAYMSREEQRSIQEALDSSHTASHIRVAQGAAYATNRAKIAFENLIEEAKRHFSIRERKRNRG